MSGRGGGGGGGGGGAILVRTGRETLDLELVGLKEAECEEELGDNRLGDGECEVEYELLLETEVLFTLANTLLEVDPGLSLPPEDPLGE